MYWSHTEVVFEFFIANWAKQESLELKICTIEGDYVVDIVFKWCISKYICNNLNYCWAFQGKYTTVCT